MLRGAQQRPQLRPEEIWLIQAHADRPPSQKRIRLARESADRQLVTTDVERAYDDGLAAEGLDDALVGAVLLVLVGHRRATEDEELGTHQADAVGAAGRREVGLFGQVDVGAEGDA